MNNDKWILSVSVADLQPETSQNTKQDCQPMERDTFTKYMLQISAEWDVADEWALSFGGEKDENFCHSNALSSRNLRLETSE